MAGEISQFEEQEIMIAEGKLQMRIAGEGEPLLLLHGELGFPGWMKYHRALSEQFRVMAPSHPGYDGSDRLCM